MTSTTTNTSASRQIYRGFADLPTEIVQLVFEASVTPGSHADDDQQRQRSAYACCLVSNEVEAWMEPLLYEKAVIESSRHVMAFLDALGSKSTEFLTRAGEESTVWILDDSFPVGALRRCHLLFDKYLSLENIACLGDSCSWILANIRKRDSCTLRELTIIQPSHTVTLVFDHPHHSLRKLQIVDSELAFIESLFMKANRHKRIKDTLQAISQVSFDFTVVPNTSFTYLLRSRCIHLLIGESQGSNSFLFIRCSPSMEAELHSQHISIFCFKDVHSWTEAFDTDVRPCGGRLTVCIRSFSEVANNPDVSYIERCKSWIGLD